MFLILLQAVKIAGSDEGFNPLIQVYVFNQENKYQISALDAQSFNPLIQVYVFNTLSFSHVLARFMKSFNPLIQVYAFNYEGTTFI